MIVPIAIVVTSVYEIPFLLNRNTLASRTLGGWQVSGIYTLEPGVPFSVLNGIDPDGTGSNFDRPDVNLLGQAGVRAVPGNSPTGYINPDAGGAAIDPKTARYVVPAAGSGRSGNGGRNTERSPGQNNVSLNGHKMFGVTEHLKMEFRWIGYDHGECGNGGGGALHEFDGGGRVIRYQLKFMF